MFNYYMIVFQNTMNHRIDDDIYYYQVAHMDNCESLNVVKNMIRYANENFFRNSKMRLINTIVTLSSTDFDNRIVSIPVIRISPQMAKVYNDMYNPDYK